MQRCGGYVTFQEETTEFVNSILHAIGFLVRAHESVFAPTVHDEMEFPVCLGACQYAMMGGRKGTLAYRAELDVAGGIHGRQWRMRLMIMSMSIC